MHARAAPQFRRTAFGIVEPDPPLYLKLGAPEHPRNPIVPLARHLGLERRQILAFGDGLNDISMIRAAGFSVAMGNAIDELKREADRIAPGNDEDGVAQVLEALFPDA